MTERTQRRGRCESASRLALPALAVLSILTAVSGCLLIPNIAPVADIEANKTDGVVPLAVHFDGTGSYDPDGLLRGYEWDFGDGDQATGAQVQHNYSRAGVFAVTLTVTDRRGAKATASTEIHVRGSNALPVAALSISPSPAYPRQAVGFSASASYDPDGEIESYAWSFGDGSAGTGAITSHSYSTQGTYGITLTVRDNDGGERTATAELRITTQIDASGMVRRHYEWTYDAQEQSCNLEIPRDLYNYYKSQPRIAFIQRDYDEYVLDPLDDDVLETVTQEILGTSAGERHAAMEDALFFVQHCVEYVNDPLWFEYPRYPIEVLVDEIGDCEDTAILYTSLVRTLGYGALMVSVDTSDDGVADHMVAWVPVEQTFVDAHPDRSFWQYQGKTYAFAETAVEGGYIPLGVDPWGLTQDDVDTVYDVSSVDRSPQAVRYTP